MQRFYYRKARKFIHIEVPWRILSNFGVGAWSLRTSLSFISVMTHYTFSYVFKLFPDPKFPFESTPDTAFDKLNRIVSPWWSCHLPSSSNRCPKIHNMFALKTKARLSAILYYNPDSSLSRHLPSALSACIVPCSA